MVIEIVTFRLADGADEGAFLAADDRVQKEFFYMQQGLVRRTTARGSNGDWLVVVFWDRPEHVEGAERTGADHPAVRSFMSFVDDSTYEVKRYASLD